MRSNRRSLEQSVRDLCADLHPDDGVPPSRRDTPREDVASDRKTLQLCAQIRRALHIAMADPRFGLPPEIHVTDVTAVADTALLDVVIEVPPEAGQPLPELRARLAAASPGLRAEVARAITRTRTPELRFTLVPASEDGP